MGLAVELAGVVVNSRTIDMILGSEIIGSFFVDGDDLDKAGLRF